MGALVDRAAQIAKNEALFRDVNERVAELNERFGASYSEPDDHWDFLCECGNEGCLERIKLTRAEYEAVRSRPTRFAIVPGHEFEDVERVVERNERFAVAEKREGVQELALGTDPRSQ